MGFCVVSGCKSRSDTHNRGTKFHVVPKDGELRDKWIAAIGRANIPKSGSVCSRHFLPQDYQLSRSGLSESLLRVAVPSQHLVPKDDDNSDDDCIIENTDDQYYSNMEFEDENNFEEFTTTIDTLDLEKEKDLPALTCVDLFPDPPHMIAQPEEPHQEDSLADDEDFLGFNMTENMKENNESVVVNDDSSVASNCDKIEKSENSKEYIVPIVESPNNQIIASTLDPVLGNIKITSISTGSTPPVSPAAYFSSPESVASSASSSKKSKKRYCRECDMHFRKTRELHEHLKAHIRMPDIRVKRLSDEHEKVKEYLSLLSPKPSPTHGGLKLKLKLMGSQNFEVVSNENGAKRLQDPEPEYSRIRILKAADIRCKPEVDDTANLDCYSQNTRPKTPNSIVPPENRYFECPTFDGLDNFSDEMMHTGEATEDLLKKLLENNKEPQSFPKEADWSANANEFISIDSLAPRCNVCHMNFSHPKYLYEHKQITGHDFPNRMGPMPQTSQPNYGHHPQNNFMQGPHPSHQNHPQHPQHQSMPPLYQMAQMRGNFPGYVPRMNARPVLHHHPQPSPPPGFHPSQCFTRTPPPLYRVNGNPQNFQQNRFHLEKRGVEMFGPGHFIGGPPQQMNPEMMRQPIFLKSRLQKAIRGKSHGPANDIPLSPSVLTQQTAIRPRFLGPNPQMPGQMHFQRAPVHSPPKPGEPPIKKIKVEQNQQHQFSSPSPNGVSSPGIRNSPGIPIIQSVHSGVSANFPQMRKQAEKPKSASPSIPEPETPAAKTPNKNPKDVANMLANRGITVTHKGKTSFVSLANKGSNSANASAQEAVQKLQANNSVSIIHKKRPPAIHISKIIAPSMLEKEGPNRVTTKFLSCPVITCKEKFLTTEGVNRHAFRWHGIPMPNPDRTQKRGIRCRVCHHVCSSQENLQEHIRREHEPTVNEIGIPIVDLRNEEVKRKLAGLGIFNYVPLTAAGASTSSLAFPVVSVQGAANPSICNLLGLGASSVLSLGPVKSISVRKAGNENK